MISAIKLKKYMTGISIFSIVISKLCYRKKLCPIILFKIDKSLEVSFDHTIVSFNLAICLRVEDDKKSLLDAKEIA